MQNRDFLYIICGYLFGSILFARLSGQIICHKDITAESPDCNPGTANAFQYGGFWCGILTLCGDLLKGYLPVHLYLSGMHPSMDGLALAFVMAAPVLGHIFPVFYRFKGGKGIAVSFGCLLGLIPKMLPLLILACTFLFFSIIIKISPHYYRTLVVYILSSVIIVMCKCEKSIVVGFLLMAGLIIAKLLSSTEEKDAFHMEVTWKH